MPLQSSDRHGLYRLVLEDTVELLELCLPSDGATMRSYGCAADLQARAVAGPHVNWLVRM